MPPKALSAVKKKDAAKPTYAVMVLRAVKDLEDRTGSSLPAITNYISSHYGTLNKSALSNALKKGVEDETLVKVKASYKLGAKGKAATKAPNPKPAPSVKKSTSKTKIPAPSSTSSSSSSSTVKPKKTIKKKSSAGAVKKTAVKKKTSMPKKKVTTSKKKVTAPEIAAK